MRTLTSLFVISILAGMFVVSGCSSSPSAEEKAQLDNLKTEVTQLEGNLKAKQNEKAALDRQIAEKNGRLKQCQSDQDAVKKALGK